MMNQLKNKKFKRAKREYEFNERIRTKKKNDVQQMINQITFLSTNNYKAMNKVIINTKKSDKEFLLKKFLNHFDQDFFNDAKLRLHSHHQTFQTYQHNFLNCNYQQIVSSILHKICELNDKIDTILKKNSQFNNLYQASNLSKRQINNQTYHEANNHYYNQNQLNFFNFKIEKVKNIRTGITPHSNLFHLQPLTFDRNSQESNQEVFQKLKFPKLLVFDVHQLVYSILDSMIKKIELNFGSNFY